VKSCANGVSARSFRARISKPRSGKQQRYYWALLRIVARHQEK